MAENTKIEWCDHSASPWHGCVEVHAGCDNCYARTMAKRNPGTLGVWGKDGTRVMSASFAKNCRRWNKSAKERGVIESVFPSIMDPFEDWQGPILDSGGAQMFTDGGRFHFSDKVRPLTMDDLRRDLFALIDECQSLRFLLLTKRPENVRRMWLPVSQEQKIRQWGGGLPGNCGLVDAGLFRPNAAILTSVSNQATADAMIPELLRCRDLVPTLGVSLEPMLGPVNLEPYLQYEPFHENYKMTFSVNDWRGIDWVIVGGESGHGSRPCRIDWVRSILDQCKEANVPCFIKQLGANVVSEHGNVIPLKDKKGGDWEEWSFDLRVREFPQPKAVPA